MNSRNPTLLTSDKWIGQCLRRDNIYSAEIVETQELELPFGRGSLYNPRRLKSDSSTGVLRLTSMFNLTRNKQISAASRAVGLLLVLFIFYGTTVEAAHRHGRVPSCNSQSASLVETGTSDGSVGTKAGCNDCLICQLHQNFSATLISVRPNSSALTVRNHLRRLDPISVHSRVNTPQSGRAPPQVN